MAYKVAVILMAPDGDPEKHQSLIRTPKLEVTTVVVELMNFDQAVEVCKSLVQNEGIHSFILCPPFTHDAVARIANAVGEKSAVTVARGDLPGVKLILGDILRNEGWFQQRP